MATNIELRRTPKGQGYWQDNGAYQKEYEQMWNELVPAMGEAETQNGEILRLSAKLYYEYFNNGNMNAQDREYPEWWCRDEDEYDVIVSEEYQSYLKFLRRSCDTDYEMQGLLKRIEDIILTGEDGCNNPDNEYTYNLMVDHAIHWVLTHDNTPLNPFKKIKR